MFFFLCFKSSNLKLTTKNKKIIFVNVVKGRRIYFKLNRTKIYCVYFHLSMQCAESHTCRAFTVL